MVWVGGVVVLVVKGLVVYMDEEFLIEFARLIDSIVYAAYKGRGVKGAMARVKKLVESIGLDGGVVAEAVADNLE